MTQFTEAAEALRAAIAANQAVADECYGAKMAALDKLDDAVEAAWTDGLLAVTEARA